MVIWSRLAGMRFCPALPGSRQRYKLFINYILRLHVKRFIPARRDPSFVQPGSCLGGTKFSHVIASARLGRIKKLIKKYPHNIKGDQGHNSAAGNRRSEKNQSWDQSVEWLVETGIGCRNVNWSLKYDSVVESQTVIWKSHLK